MLLLDRFQITRPGENIPLRQRIYIDSFFPATIAADSQFVVSGLDQIVTFLL